MFFKKKIEDKEILKDIHEEACKAYIPFLRNLLNDNRAKKSNTNMLTREAQILFWALPAIVVSCSKLPDISKQFIVKSTRQRTIDLLKGASQLDSSSILDARFHSYLEQFMENDDLRSVLFAFHSYTDFINMEFNYGADSLSLSTIQETTTNIIQIVEAAKKYKVVRASSSMSTDDWNEITYTASNVIYDSAGSLISNKER